MYKVYELGEFSEKILFTLLAYQKVMSHPKGILLYPAIMDRLEFDKRLVKRYYANKKINYALSKLKKKGYINIYKTDKRRFNVSFTSKTFEFIKLKHISENAKSYKKMRNYKRILFFDIPERERKKRDSFRYFLKILGFNEIQKSVFVSELDNYDDLKSIIDFLEIGIYVETGIYKKD
ncbi:MAG: CRISPR-associated endonuclease Cas2 [Elusimicrobiales bacterium]|jgi:DNA-binding transcriptional regulator PaaX|nr:CRISPR-associated endonuclease Cas2 [Elusimicrobiales bacterium]